PNLWDILRPSERNFKFIVTSLFVRIILSLNDCIEMSDGIRETSFCEQFGGLVAQFSAKEGFEVLVEIHGSACGTSANRAFFDAKRGLLEHFVRDKILRLALT